MGPARGRIDPGADSAPDGAALGVFVVAVNARAVVLVLLQNSETPGGRAVTTFPGGDGAIDPNLVSDQQVGTLLADGDNDL
jgi:hypothetical protein